MPAGQRIRQAAALAGQNAAVHVDFGAVRQAAAVSKVAGMDVRGYRHSISNQAIRHIRTRHPDVEVAAIARLPEMVRSAPTLGEPGLNGVPRLVWRSTVGGQRFTYVAEVRRRRRRLDAITLFKG